MLFSYYILLAFGLYSVEVCTGAPLDGNNQLADIKDWKEKAKKYLRRYGYYGDENPDPKYHVTEADDAMMKDMIMDFQTMADIPQTGVLDDETMEVMDMPRCGVNDKMSMSDMMRRRKRYVLTGSKWSSTNISYKFINYSPDLPNREIENTIKDAFKAWSDVSSLDFYKVDDAAVINIGFYSGQHGDGESFDGRGGTLAHAFFPTSAAIGGDSHFDEAEDWTVRTRAGTNLYQVAVHEFGHALGLSHSNDRNAIMYAIYRGYIANPSLHPDDVAGIQAVYGPRRAPPSPTPALPGPTAAPPIPTQPPTMRPMVQSLCQGAGIDAIENTPYGVFIFKGTNFYVGDDYGAKLSNTIPFPNPVVFKPAFHNPDAALFRVNDDVQEFFIFKGDAVHEFVNGILTQNPYTIASLFPGAPTHIDAALWWGYNKHTYLFKGDRYYKYDGYVLIDRDQPVKRWGNIPRSLGDAVQYKNGLTYFFEKDSDNYYRYNDFQLTVESGYPRSARDAWYGCSTAGEFMRNEGMDQMSKLLVEMPMNSENSTASVCSTKGTLVALCIVVIYGLGYANAW